MRRVMLVILLAVFLVASPMLGAQDEAEATPPAESVLIAIHPTGFDPEELSVPAGKVFFLIEDRSGLKQVVLELHQETAGGKQLIQLPDGTEKGALQDRLAIPRERALWGGPVGLSAGKYVLGEVDHPKWSCRITVTEN